MIYRRIRMIALPWNDQGLVRFEMTIAPHETASLHTMSPMTKPADRPRDLEFNVVFIIETDEPPSRVNAIGQIEDSALSVMKSVTFVFRFVMNDEPLDPGELYACTVAMMQRDMAYGAFQTYGMDLDFGARKKNLSQGSIAHVVYRMAE